MATTKFSLVRARDERLAELVKTTDHKTLAVWAIDCAMRAMPYFEEKYPQDNRPRRAIQTLQAWVETGAFSMAVIRKAALDAHAAARGVGEDSPARSAARAAGQAVATAHVPTHAPGAAVYALQAIFRATPSYSVDAALAAEREWQYRRLLELRKASTTPDSQPVKKGDWHFYIVRCRDGTLYSGMTNNLDERLKKHNQGKGAKYTASRRPVYLVHSERFDDSSGAKKREREVKGWPKSRKERLISGTERNACKEKKV